MKVVPDLLLADYAVQPIDVTEIYAYEVLRLIKTRERRKYAEDAVLGVRVHEGLWMIATSDLGGVVCTSVGGMSFRFLAGHSLPMLYQLESSASEGEMRTHLLQRPRRASCTNVYALAILLQPKDPASLA